MAESTIPPDDEKTIRRIVGALVHHDTPGRRAMWRLFTSYPEIDREEMEQEGIVAVLRDWPKYDASKSRKTTFIQQRAYSAIVTLYRHCKAGRNKIKRIQAKTTEADFIEKPQREPDDLPLPRFLEETMQAARRVYNGARWKRGRRHYSAPQFVAIAAMMRRHNLSTRQTHLLLLDREDCRKALRLNRRVPSQPQLWRAVEAFGELSPKTPMN